MRRSRLSHSASDTRQSPESRRLRLSRVCERVFKKDYRIGAPCSRTFRSRTRYSPKNFSRGGWNRRHGARSSLGRERQLERRQRRLERRGQLGREPEQVERRQPGPVSLLLSFPAFLWRGFAFQAALPATDHAPHFLDIFSKCHIFIVRYQRRLPCKLKEKPQRVRFQHRFY